jgi:cyclic pyranopterin phosphate synthase
MIADIGDIRDLSMTTKGKLRPCLFNDVGFDIRKLGNERAINMAVNAKSEQGINNIKDSFYNIGG